jgi:type VI secretion system protein ImpM
MNPAMVNVPVSYFGKLPALGDFIKASQNHQPLTAVLDRWASSGLELLAQDVGWKEMYDRGAGVNFAFMSSRRRPVVAGHLLPSNDQSGRRFPFFAAVTFEVAHPLAFLGHCPQAFSRLWSRLGRELPLLKTAAEPASLLAEWQTQYASIAVDQRALDLAFQDFLEMQTIGSLEHLLTAAGHAVDVRRIMIALGVLLKPVMASGAPRMGKGLGLPLPEDPLSRQLVASFWLESIAGFLGNSEFELLLMMPGGACPMMILSFAGASPRSLCGVFDTQLLEEDVIMLTDPDWVEDSISEASTLSKISNYTRQKDLTLATARTTFRETFLGAR